MHILLCRRATKNDVYNDRFWRRRRKGYIFLAYFLMYACRVYSYILQDLPPPVLHPLHTRRRLHHVVTGSLNQPIPLHLSPATVNKTVYRRKYVILNSNSVSSSSVVKADQFATTILR